MSTLYTHACTRWSYIFVLSCLRILCAQLENTFVEMKAPALRFHFPRTTISLRLLAAVLSLCIFPSRNGDGGIKIRGLSSSPSSPSDERRRGGRRKTHSPLSRAEKEKKTSTPLVNFKRRRTLLVQSAANPFIFLRQRKRKCPLCFKSPFAKIPRIHCKKSWTE